MGFRIKKIQPRLLRKKKAHDAQEVLNRLQSFLNQSMTEPVRILRGFWADQINAISYQEIRAAILDGALADDVFREWRQDYSKLVINSFSNVWKEAMALGHTGQPSMDNLKNFRLDMQRPGVINWINQRGAEFVTYSTGEQREAIKTLLARNIVDKHTVDELARAIRPTVGLYKGQALANLRYYDNVKKTLTEQHPKMSAASVQHKAQEAALKYAEKQHRERAMMIARTERSFAFNRGAYEGIKQAVEMGLLPPQIKVWSTSRGGNVCPECEALEGEEVGMDDPFFESRGLFKGDNLLPPLHPSCYCAIIYRDMDSKEMDQYRRDDGGQTPDEDPTYREPIGVKADGTWAYEEDLDRAQYYVDDKDKNVVIEPHTRTPQTTQKPISANPTSVKPNDDKNTNRSGGVSGAYNDKNDPDYSKRTAIAEELYAEVKNRKREYEIKAVAAHSGFSEDEIDRVYKHLFERKHLFEDGRIGYFDPDYFMIHSWLRVREGKVIHKHDIILLHHELEEEKIMGDSLEIYYEKAHNEVEKTWSYQSALLEYLEDHDV